MSRTYGPAAAAASGPTAAILTASDGCAAGVVPDRSGVVARRILQEAGFRIADSAIVPDELDAIRERVGAWAASGMDC